MKLSPEERKERKRESNKRYLQNRTEEQREERKEKIKEYNNVLLQMELEKSISRVSHFLIVQLRCNFNRIFT